MSLDARVCGRWSVAGTLGAALCAVPPIAGQRPRSRLRQRLQPPATGATTAATPAAQKYSPLDQINRDNVKNLRIAWRWKADNFGPSPEFNLQATPLAVNGILYTTAGTRRHVVAIDGATGETLWTYRYDEGERGRQAPRQNHRGVAYWTDGRGDERILYITAGYHLIALEREDRPADCVVRQGRRRRSVR